MSTYKDRFPQYHQYLGRVSVKDLAPITPGMCIRNLNGEKAGFIVSRLWNKFTVGTIIGEKYNILYAPGSDEVMAGWPEWATTSDETHIVSFSTRKLHISTSYISAVVGNGMPKAPPASSFSASYSLTNMMWHMSRDYLDPENISEKTIKYLIKDVPSTAFPLVRKFFKANNHLLYKPALCSQ